MQVFIYTKLIYIYLVCIALIIRNTQTVTAAAGTAHFTYLSNNLLPAWPT